MRRVCVFLSVFDMFKVGIGPSSSHTVGPMVAMNKFLLVLAEDERLDDVESLRVTLKGSLAFTGKGHGTDRAVILGLLGEKPDAVDPGAVESQISEVVETGKLRLAGARTIPFTMDEHIVFDYGQPLDEHTNGLIAEALAQDGSVICSRTYFSVGGGFVVEQSEFAAFAEQGVRYPEVPYPFSSAEQMLALGDEHGLSIAEMKRANELSQHDEARLKDGLAMIWTTMRDCMDRGMSTDGRLPGGLDVKRRAAEIARQMQNDQTRNMKYQHTVMDWISLYAMAVNEENAAGGKIVTAPTNGAAGVIPATIRYYLEFCPGADDTSVETFLLTAAAIGGLIKANASISGAEVGCQGEVGSAAAMAAAGLCAVLGGTNAQIENAAEIAIEHHLGMTCDPVGGLVQVPCIERNAMGAVKAVNAASLALRGDGSHFVPLDNAIETMRQTGIDMLSKYKKTSQGGLAVNITEC